ncbi:MAG: Jag N-terminal domain-containing protein [Clostridia bacterium]|nr:Jag N-terminal domain-containing protein [Clostridia bacterium]
MIKEIIASGKDIIEAKENARAALGAGPLDDVNFEIIHAGSRGIFGIIGVKPAQVRAYIEIPDPVEKRPKRHEKPKRDKNPHEEKKNAGSDKPKKNKNEKKDEPKTEKPAAIPEAELKFEKRDVKDGEDMSFEFVKTVIADIGLSAEATLYSCEDGTRKIIIEGEDASTLIGHHGDTLDALQYLANLASARKNINGERDKSRVTIDIEGYRAKREETLRALARRMAAKALRNKRSVMLEPMSAYERRIIHSEVQGIEGVSTNSVGSDNNRKIVIYLTDKKPKGIFDEETVESNEAVVDVAVDTEATVSEEAVSVSEDAPAEEA